MPKDHFLRDLDRLVNFEFIYDRVESLYSHTGRRSINPVVIVKVMLLGYLYGIDSERRLEQEVKKSTTDPDSGYMHRPGKPNGFFTSVTKPVTVKTG